MYEVGYADMKAFREVFRKIHVYMSPLKIGESIIKMRRCNNLSAYLFIHSNFYIPYPRAA